MSKQMWVSYSAFVRDRLIVGKTLVCPVRVLWKGYIEYCGVWGFEPASAHEFVGWLAAEEGVELRMHGSGDLRHVALGIGFTAGVLKCQTG